jgi:ABC-2 type transport system permease protein
MNRALIYLFTRSFWNSIAVRVKRLRQPKYLIGALIGGAYFYFYFYRFLFRGDFQGREKVVEAGTRFVLGEDVRINLAALGLFVAVVVFGWIVPSSRAALHFSEAEVAWLFPAPLTRAQLIRFRLIKSQLGLLLIALLMTILTGRLAHDGHALLHTFGWWIVLTALQLHRLAASFTITRLMDRGLSTAWRRLGAIALAGAFIWLMTLWARQAPAMPQLDEFQAEGTLATYIGGLASAGPAEWLLMPFRWVVRPWFAATPSAFIVATGPALLIILAHYFWVMRSEVAFEEASVQLSEKRAALVAAHQSGNMRFRIAPRSEQTPLFSLRPRGWPALGFAWKSWIRFGGRRVLRMGILVAFLCIIAASAPLIVPEWKAFGGVSMMAGFAVICALLFSGPQLTAQSLRRELQSVEWLKACPVPPSQIVFGQILGPALVWSAIEWVGGIVLLLGAAGVPRALPNPALVAPLIAAGALLFLPPFNIVASLVPSGVMLLFPGWFKPGEVRGIEATGLGIIMLFAQLLFLALSLVPPALTFAGIAYVSHLVLPLIPSLALGTVFAASTLAVESWLGALVLGQILARFDSSAER